MIKQEIVFLVTQEENKLHPNKNSVCVKQYSIQHAIYPKVNNFSLYQAGQESIWIKKREWMRVSHLSKTLEKNTNISRLSSLDPITKGWRYHRLSGCCMCHLRWGRSTAPSSGASCSWSPKQREEIGVYGQGSELAQKCLHLFQYWKINAWESWWMGRIKYRTKK